MLENVFSEVKKIICTRYFAGLFCIYLLGISSILRANRLYLDDLGRSLYGYADWISAARPLSELLAWLFYLGPLTVDAAPLTQILAAGLLAFASLLFLDAFRMEKTWTHVLCLVPVGLSPYGLENLSYRFDAPLMSLAVLLAILPYSLRLRRRWWRCAVSSVCLFASGCLYQPALGAYLAVAVYRLLLLVSSKTRMRRVINIAARMVLPFLLGAGLYAAQAPFWLCKSQYADYVASHAVVPPVTKLPEVVLNNMLHYSSLLWHDWSENGLGLLMAGVFTAFIVLIGIRLVQSMHRRQRPGAYGLRLLLLPPLAVALFFSPFGIQYVLDVPVWAPRTFQGFGVMLSLPLLYVCSSMKEGVWRRCHQVLQGMLVLQLLIFSQVYGNLLSVQGDWELSRLSMLGADLNTFINTTGSSRVDFVGSIGLSPLVRIPAVKYPLLERLVTVPLTRDWRWGFEQLNSFGVKLEWANVDHPEAVERFTPFLARAAYRIDITPEGTGVVTFLPQPNPQPLKKKNR